MEITKLSETTIKIKGKHATCLINPVDLHSKLSAACVLFFEKISMPLDMKFFEKEPLIIQGSGEYEVGGIKTTGMKNGESSVYRIMIDGMDMLVAKTSLLGKIKESEYKILLLEADTLADQSIITALDPNVIIFYGQYKEESAKAIGKEFGTVSKFMMTRDKLPTDIQVLILQ